MLPDPNGRLPPNAELVRLLVSVSESERVNWIVLAMPGRPCAALHVAIRSRLRKETMRRLLSDTVGGSDASTIRCWMETAMKVLGREGAVSEYVSWVQGGKVSPKSVGYWIVGVLGDGSEELVQQFVTESRNQ